MNENQEIRQRNSIGVYILELAFLVATFFVTCGEFPPDVNESHYLTKAKNFWNPDWCSKDFFLNSPDAHHVFYFTIGWLTLLFPLPVVAWIGRTFAWIGLAWSWQRLSFRLTPVRFASVVSASIMILLIEYCHLAGEWLVGGVEAKCFAYIAMFFGIERILAGKWRWTWVSLAFAGVFHILIGGWAFAIAIVVFVWGRPCRKEIWAQLPLMCISIAILLAAAYPAWNLSSTADSETVAIANETYVHVRLPHHLYFWAFEKPRTTLFFLALVGWFVTNRDFARRLNAVKSEPRNKPQNPSPNESTSIERAGASWIRFCNVTFLVALAGIGLGCLASSETYRNVSNSLLRFYWFRLSDVMMGAGLGVVLSTFLASIFSRILGKKSIANGMLFTAIIMLLFSSLLRLSQTDWRPPADRAALANYPLERRRTDDTFRNWRRVCKWIEDNTPSDALFLTPKDQQTFNWYSGRSQFVCYKDIPQDAAGICSWATRIEKVLSKQNDYQYMTSDVLVATCEESKIDYVVFHQSIVEWRENEGYPVQLKMVYPENPDARTTFVVYQVAK